MRSFFLFFLFSTSLFAQDPYLDLNEGFRQFGEVMLISAGDADSLSLARSPMIEPCDKNEEQNLQEIDLGLVAEEKSESKWRFSVMVGMGGPRDSLKKHYADQGPAYAALGNELDAIIGQNYSSHSARMNAVKAACNGKSEMEVIGMASNLASRLSNIYDYDRIDNGPTSDLVVTPENQWNALHARAGGNYSATSGVCRDASYTVSQMLLACGFKPGQISIEGYRTAGGGHQVTTVRTSDGEAYTINWNELYSVDENGQVAAAPNPDLVNTGLFYTVYDPVTGEAVEKRRTELGEVLKAVTGGTVSDPNYLPDLLRLEASYGIISANYFQTETARGDFARGVALHMQKDDLIGFLDLTAGVAYANNSREVATSALSSSELQQHILYGQIEGRFRIPDLMLIDREDRSLALRPSAQVSVEGYLSRNTLDQENPERNADSNAEVKLGVTSLYNRGKLATYVGADVDMNIVAYRFNSERGTPGEDGDYGGVGAFANSYNIHGGISWDGDRFTPAITSEHTIARSGTRTSLGTSLMDHGMNSSYSAVYSVYDRNYGKREDFVVFRAEKDFVIEKVGEVNVGFESQAPLADNFNEATVGLSVRFYPGRGR